MANSRELYARLLGYLKPYRLAFILGILCIALMGATEPLLPALLKPLLDKGFGGASPDYLWKAPLGVVLLFLLRGILSYTGGYLTSWVSNHIITDVRIAMFDRILRLPTRYYDDQSTGILMSKVTYDVSNVTNAATSVLNVAVKDSLNVIGLIALLLYLNWQLTLVVLAIGPAVAIVVKAFGGRLRRASRSAQGAMGSITQILEEAIGGHRVVKIFGGQAYEARRFADANHQLRSANMRQAIAAAATVPLVQICAAIALAIVIYVALLQSAEGTTTVGGFAAFVSAMLMLLAPVRHLTEINAPLQRGLAAAESLFTVIDELPEDDKGTTVLARARGEVAFEDVTFTYPEAQRPAVRNITLTIAAGESVALVGASGSGKTTLAHLIPRFYHPQSGCIRVDGHALETLTLDSLRANLAFVSQDVVLFNDSIAANIAYGAMAGASREAIEAAARAAFAHDFIMATPQGYDTEVGENGVKLSGGQRQRLAIARALLKDAPILILDEATSALDTESERQVQAALDVLMRHRTTLVIAHRLSTIEKADRIVVLDQGRIVEAGKHGELLARGGAYARLHQLQFVAGDEAA